MNTDYHRLLVAPHSIRNGLIERIDREIEHARAGLPSGIRFKCNAVVDERIIDALYRASQAGVPIKIWVRGICAIRPGVPGLSDNIEVISILGRFLEHSRAFEFCNDGDTEVWIGSADLMHRNLDRRVEALVSLKSREDIAEVNALFLLAFDPGTAAWDLRSDGSWQRRTRNPDGGPLRDLQETLIEVHRTRGRLV
jgi:polyphosphate kinase